MKETSTRKYRITVLLAILLCLLAACGDSATASNTKSATNSSTGSKQSPATTVVTSTPQVQAGARPCPATVSDPSHWDPIVITQNGVNTVSSVTCGNLTGSDTIQALVTVQYQGTGQVTDIYVFDAITSPVPTKLFLLQGLYRGSAKISAYGTILTTEVDQGSSVNQGKSNATYQADLFREFQWSSATGTFIPVSFPGIFPDLTRYQAENDQQQVDGGSDAWKLDAPSVASKLAGQLLNWTSIASSTSTSGGSKQDATATVTVKNTQGGTIQVTLGRLENNTKSGIWEATGVTASGITINTPQNRDLLRSPFSITGTSGENGRVTVLDHLYNNVTQGTASVTSANFSTNVSYNVSFKTGAQEGLLIVDTGTGAAILKELLGV